MGSRREREIRAGDFASPRRRGLKSADPSESTSLPTAFKEALAIYYYPGTWDWQPKLKQSLIAVGSGGAFGRGFGEGRQQLGFVPFGYNDFIASNIGEEWGFAGLLLLTVAFAMYAWLGFRIARSARSPFLQLVALGLTVTVVVTAFLHIGVVVGLLPTTGLTLPFISYGRSNLVLSLFMTGLLVNIGSHKERVHGVAATNPLAAPAW